MIWDMVSGSRGPTFHFQVACFGLRMHLPRFEHHLLHIHTCQGHESLGLCWEPQYEIWMAVDLKSEVSRMNGNHYSQ